MEDLAKKLGLEYIELELLKMIHPIFDVCMTRKMACENLGICVSTGRRIWNDMLIKYPALTDSMGKWNNPRGIKREKVRSPRRVGFIDTIDIENGDFDGDRVVRRF